MEKKWFRGFRLFASFALMAGFSFSAVAQSQIQEVSVEVDIKADNAAAAAEEAQRLAFREAVARTLDAGITEEERAGILRSAQNYIKSFQLVSKREEGGKLYATYTCEVVLNSANGATSFDNAYQQRFALEFSWKPNRSKPSLSSFRKLLIEDYGLSLNLVKLDAESWWIEMRTTQTPEAVFARLAGRFRDQAEIRLIKDLEGLFSKPMNDNQSQ